jgi:hypothetical protein
MWTVELNCVGLLNFNDPKAPYAFDAKQVTGYLGQASLLYQQPWLAGGLGVPVRTLSHHSGGGGASGAGSSATGSLRRRNASFSICLMVGIRQEAGRSFIPPLEHNENKYQGHKPGTVSVC